ncbi:hypothetical protein V6N13_088352 [Hibiscus sabdariffa]|uniref:Uncharacterized protein n=1 Tax=Hibiscus sabdariffa TaxID=183260 RepID=A0ABR2FZ20_9ROSI
MEYIEEVVSLSCEGDCHPVLVREINYSFWSSSYLKDPKVSAFSVSNQAFGDVSSDSDSISAMVCSTSPRRSMVVHSQGRVEGSKVPPFGGINHSTNLEGCAESFPEIVFMNACEISSLAIKNREHLWLDILERCAGVSIQESHSNMFQWHVASKPACDILNMSLGCELIKEACEMVPCSNDNISWARRVDMENGNTEAFAHESDDESEQVNMFPELQVLNKRN